MIRSSRAIFGALLGLAAASAFGQSCPANCPTTGAACNAFISSGSVTAAVEARSAGQTLCLGTGTYTPATTASWADANAFAIGRAITVCGCGTGGTTNTNAAQTILQGGAASDYAVKFTRYPSGGPTPDGATLTNVQVNTATGSNGGILVQDFVNSTRVNGVTLRDLVVNTKTSGSANGILLFHTDKINISNVTVTSNQTALTVIDSTATLIANSTVTGTSGANSNALAVSGGTGNVIVGNTFGSPKAGSSYSIQSGGIVFYNTTTNRFENNVVQGFQFDGLDFDAKDVAPGGVPAAQSVDNYVGKNTIISTGAADGLVTGSAIWSNCGSNNNWIYGNDAAGSPECGVCTWLVKSNMVLANTLHANNLAGIVVDGGNLDTLPFCGAAGGAFQARPNNTYLVSNYVYFNKNDQVVVRSSDNTTIASNLLSASNGLGGGMQSSTGCGLACQSAFTFDTDGASNSGARIVANTSHQNIRGFQSDQGTTTGIEFAYNRMLQGDPNSFSRYVLAGSTNWDGGGPKAGGNYWSLFLSPNGNPGTNPYGSNGVGNSHLGVYDSAPNNTTGRIVDRYPYQSEDFGKGYNVTVLEPYASTSAARNSRRTVRWYAPGCVYMDLALDGTTPLGSPNVANTGYAVVTIPVSASIGAHTILVTCKDSAGAARGSGSSPSFSVTDSTLKLLSPGRDDVLNANSEIIVSWTKASASSTVTIGVSTSGNAGPFTPIAGTFSGYSARVTLPNVASSANAVLRITGNGANQMDDTDGYFAIRGTSGAGIASPIGNVTPGRQFVMGKLEHLQWASPQNSRLVDITATVGGVAKTVAANLPDRGHYDWIVPEWAATGTMTLQVNFKTTAGAAISSVSTTNGAAAFPTGSGALNPPRLLNISTRGQVLTNFDVMIGGFVISGPAPKTVVVRAIGPSLVNFGINNYLPNPQLQLVRSSDQVTLASNDDWGSAPNIGSLIASGFAPSHGRESAILITLNPGAYTAIVSGVSDVQGATGVGLVEVYEVDRPDVNMINISTRGKVLTGFDVMIGGFVVTGTGSQQVIVRAIGPSLTNFGVAGALPDPQLQLVRQSDQVVIGSNDNWGNAPNVAAIQSSGFAPSHPLESAVLMTLSPGAYTAIVSGVNNGTGVGLVEVYTVP